MESSTWPESLPSNRIKAIQELTQGQQLTDRLREMLDHPEQIESDLMSIDSVVGQILGMFDNTLSILSSTKYHEISHIRTGDMRSPCSWDDLKSGDSDESIKTVVPVKSKRGCYKRRKNSSTITKVTSTLIDDGYAWRKYGQKVILNSKHHRAYYRCTHKIEQGCQATKQVQMIEDEPPKYKITYNGHHTCNNLLKAPQIIMDSPNTMHDTSTILNFETNTAIGNKQVDPCLSSSKRNKVSYDDDYIPWDLVTQLSQVPLQPVPVMSSGLDHEDTVSSGVFSSTCSTLGYEIDNMLECNDFSDILFECS